MFWLLAIALLMSLSRQSPTNPPGFDYRILFDRYNTTLCHYQSLEEMIDPIMWNNGVEIEERDCHNFKDGLTFVGFSYIWSAHTGSHLETLAGYGKCEIAIYGRDGCAGEAVGWVNNANTKNQSRNLCYAMEGREGKSVKVSCDRKKRTDWDPEIDLPKPFNWNQCKKGPCYPPTD